MFNTLNIRLESCLHQQNESTYNTRKQRNFHCQIIQILHSTKKYKQVTVPTNSVSLHTARKIFIYLLTYLVTTVDDEVLR